MAAYITKLASVGANAIQTALRQHPLSPECQRELATLAQAVEKAPKVQRDVKRRTPESDFHEHVLPKLKRVMEEHRRNPSDCVLQEVDLFFEDVKFCTKQELVARHRVLIEGEDSLKLSILLVRYQRGLVYLRAHELIPDFEELKDWLFKEFTIAYSTATAYMSVTKLLQNYPILLKAGLSFEQLRRHAKYIRAFAKKEGCELSETCVIMTSGGQEVGTIAVSVSEVQVRDAAYHDADFEYHQGADEQQSSFPCFEALVAEVDGDDLYEDCE